MTFTSDTYDARSRAVHPFGRLLSTPVVTEAPELEPLTVADAKSFMRVTHSDDDAMILEMIQEAREWAEGYTGRSFITQTVRADFDALATALRLPRGPFVSLESVSLLSLGEVTAQTLTDFYVEGADPGTLRRKAGGVFATTGSVRVTFVAGYGDTADSVPADIRRALKMKVAELYEQRVGFEVGKAISAHASTPESFLSRYRYDYL